MAPDKKKNSTEQTEKFDWTLNCEVFIRLVKGHPCLYDIKSKLFRNVIIKNQAWQTVATAFGCSKLLVIK